MKCDFALPSIARALVTKSVVKQIWFFLEFYLCQAWDPALSALNNESISVKFGVTHAGRFLSSVVFRSPSQLVIIVYTSDLSVELLT